MYLTALVAAVNTAFAKVPSYVHTAAESRAYVLQYSRVECEGNPAKPRLPYRATFEKALRGNFDALHTVLVNEHYHTNDTQWNRVPWHILQVVGDSRFAAFVLSRPLAERARLIDVEAYNVGEQQEAAYEAFFRKRFPRTYALWQKYGSG
jgi:hypothetical protein